MEDQLKGGGDEAIGPEDTASRSKRIQEKFAELLAASEARHSREKKPDNAQKTQHENPTPSEASTIPNAPNQRRPSAPNFASSDEEMLSNQQEKATDIDQDLEGFEKDLARFREDLENFNQEEATGEQVYHYRDDPALTNMVAELDNKERHLNNFLRPIASPTPSELDFARQSPSAHNLEVDTGLKEIKKNTNTENSQDATQTHNNANQGLKY